MTTMTTKHQKPKTPKPHAMAFVGDAPCTICGCEWFRPTIQFVPGGEAVEGVACANLWCPIIGQLRNRLTTLTVTHNILRIEAGRAIHAFSAISPEPVAEHAKYGVHDDAPIGLVFDALRCAARVTFNEHGSFSLQEGEVPS